MRSRLFIGIITLALAAPTVATAQIINGDFTDTTGAPWTFMSESLDGSVNYSAMEAVVTGGDDGVSSDVYDSIQQSFIAPASTMVTIEFDWSYFSLDTPGYDAAFWDVIDNATGLSVIGGPVFLADTSPASGAVSQDFSGSGDFTVRLGSWSDDAIFDPGVSTFDNVVLIGGALTSFVRGDLNDDGSIDISDAVFGLGALFIPGSPLSTCADASDTNDDSSYDVSDIVFLLAALFVPGATPIPEPVSCGDDPTADALTCDTHTSCP
ncbi:MAG: hypothetical protein KDC38_07915 [Planctomycetes bacterium]|nr:hypothetical protein [Planctomycetota bacterium]